MVCSILLGRERWILTEWEMTRNLPLLIHIECRMPSNTQHATESLYETCGFSCSSSTFSFLPSHLTLVMNDTPDHEAER